MTGIYKITNPIGQVYIGSAVNVFLRWAKHCYTSSNIKDVSKVAKSFKAYGIENHKFEILENCEKMVLLKRERHYQDTHNSYSEWNLNSYRAFNTVYKNGKRQKTSSSRNKFVFDKESGVYYDTLNEVSFLYGIPRVTLRYNILGRNDRKPKKPVRWVIV